jgi:hypothetical protein
MGTGRARGGVHVEERPIASRARHALIKVHGWTEFREE